MDFLWTEQQELFRETLRDFVKKEITPGYRERTKQEGFHWPEHRKLAELGILGMGMPEEYGGDGELDYFMMGIAAEEIGYGDIGVGYGVLLAGLMGQIINNYAIERIKKEWLPSITAGEKIIALGITEPDSGSDAAAMKMTAVREGDEYVLNGEKTSVTSAPHAQAAVIFAKTDPAKKSGGVSAFFVPLDLPGVLIGKFNDMGWKTVGRGSISLDNVRIPVDNLIGPEGKGFHIVMNGFDFSRVLIGLSCVGAAQASLDDAINYTKVRKAFGHPLARYEGIQFPIAEYLTKLEGARNLCYKALWLRQQNLPHTREAAMVKWWAPKIAVEAAHQSLLFHGHSGYSDEYPLQQRLRDIIGYEIGDGTAEIQKIIIARETFGREFLPY